jgi:excisionase family DNA binding protein
MADEWLTVNQAAEISGYSVQYVRRLLRQGRVQSQKFLTVWQINRLALLAYIRDAQKSEDKRWGPKAGA